MAFLGTGQPEYMGTAAISDGDYVHVAISHADLIIMVGHDVVEKPPFFMHPKDTRKVLQGFEPTINYLFKYFLPTRVCFPIHIQLRLRGLPSTLPFMYNPPPGSRRARLYVSLDVLGS